MSSLETGSFSIRLCREWLGTVVNPWFLGGLLIFPGNRRKSPVDPMNAASESPAFHQASLSTKQYFCSAYQTYFLFMKASDFYWKNGRGSTAIKARVHTTKYKWNSKHHEQPHGPPSKHRVIFIVENDRGQGRIEGNAICKQKAEEAAPTFCSQYLQVFPLDDLRAIRASKMSLCIEQ